MEGPLFAPETLTGIGSFLFIVLFFAWLVLTGRIHTDKEFQRERQIGEMWRKSYEREVAAKELRWNAMGQMVLESTKTVAHALESIQDEARAESGGSREVR